MERKSGPLRENYSSKDTQEHWNNRYLTWEIVHIVTMIMKESNDAHSNIYTLKLTK